MTSSTPAPLLSARHPNTAPLGVRASTEGQGGRAHCSVQSSPGAASEGHGAPSGFETARLGTGNEASSVSQAGLGSDACRPGQEGGQCL